MTQRTIFYPPTINWGYMFQRPQQILRQFARDGWRVIYVDNKPQWAHGGREAEPNVWVYPSVDEAIQAVGGRVDVLYCTWSKTAEYADRLNARAVVYDCLDKFPSWQPFEDSMIQRADIVFAASGMLVEKVLAHGKTPVICRNAAASELLDRRASRAKHAISLPEKPVGHPLAGFIGYVGPWVDRILLEDVARACPLMIVGPKAGEPIPHVVHWTGEVPFESLPGYYNRIDIGVLPFGFSEVAQYSCPIKVYEYLACGLPVVATPIPEACYLSDRGVIRVADPNDFAMAVHEELASDTLDKRERRKAYARQNMWHHRYLTMLKTINQHLEVL